MALSDRIVVMQQGRILQIGEPEAVYHRPASREVATFFGTPNMIAAKVATCRATDNGDYMLAVEGAAWQGLCRAGERFGQDEAVLVVVRPETVALAAPGTPASDGHIAWPGRVVDGIFRGPHRSIEAEAAGMRFHIEAPATRPVSIGEAVTLSVAAENVWAVRA